MSATVIELIAPYARQTELETTITEIVRTQRGLKESDLWVLVAERMSRGARETTPPVLIAGTIHRMIRNGHLTGINYAFGDDDNTFVLPANSVLEIVRSEWVQRNAHSVL